MYRLAWQGVAPIQEIRKWPEHEFQAWVAWLKVENEPPPERDDSEDKD